MTSHWSNLADWLEAEAGDAEDHYCSDTGNFAGGYDCICQRSGWYTHLSYPPYKGCMFFYKMKKAANALREAERLEALCKAVQNYIEANADAACPTGTNISEWWDDPKTQKAFIRQDQAYEHMENWFNSLKSKNES